MALDILLKSLSKKFKKMKYETEVYFGMEKPSYLCISNKKHSWITRNPSITIHPQTPCIYKIIFWADWLVEDEFFETFDITDQNFDPDIIIEKVKYFLEKEIHRG